MVSFRGSKKAWATPRSVSKFPTSILTPFICGVPPPPGKAVPSFLSYFFPTLLHLYTRTSQKLLHFKHGPTTNRDDYLITLITSSYMKEIWGTWLWVVDKGLVHTYPFLFENRDIFSPVWSTQPHDKKRSSKTHLLKNALQSGDFWKRHFAALARVDGWERRVLKTTTSWCWNPVIAHASIKDGTVYNSHHILPYLWTGRNDWKNATCKRELLKTEKNGYVWTGPKSWLRLWTFGGFFCNIRVLPLHWPVGSFHCWKAWKQ